MEKILITGGAGYIGSVLTEILLENGYKVCVVDKLLYNKTSLINCCSFENFDFIKSDVLDTENYSKEIKNSDNEIFQILSNKIIPKNEYKNIFKKITQKGQALIEYNNQLIISNGVIINT